MTQTSEAAPSADRSHIDAFSPEVLNGRALGREPSHEPQAQSRQRWRDFVGMAVDLAYETDAWGRFVFVTPDPALGWPADTLIGQHSGLLLAGPEGASRFDPFAPTTRIERRRAWLKRPDGTAACLSFSAAPLLDAAGRVVGGRGVAVDLTEQDRRDSAMATALRRAEVLDHVLRHIHAEVLAPRMMQAALTALAQVLGAAGAIVLDTHAAAVVAAEPAGLGDTEIGVASTGDGVLHRIGNPPDAVAEHCLRMLRAGSPAARKGETVAGHPLLTVATQTRFGVQAGLALWREPGAPAWKDEDLTLVRSAASIIRVVLEHDHIQQEMARQARTDPLTGLPNRRAFLDEVTRRIDRLDRARLPGVLMFVDLDSFKALNDRLGHECGDEALRIVTALLRATVRPADLVARLGGDEFALWLDGADELTAAERAESLRVEGPRVLAHFAAGDAAGLGLSIGIAMRWPGGEEEIDTLMRRADQAMCEVKRRGRGHWRVWHAEPG
ncbi:MAG: sensor domain-containing diguanylate cyclase [Acidisphaera sp.]|nr:sensor domain-containing diguanylate cyclase [Acidisphaera sp.]